MILMKITDIVYKSYEEVREMPRFDLTSMPKKPKWYLQLLAWVLAFPETFSVRPTIRKHNMEGLKGPFIMLCNHNSFLDFKIATRAVFPRRSTYIVAVDGFIGREGIMRNVGCFAKRKFMSDRAIVRQIKHTIENDKVICQIYPEARYSLVGTNSPLPESLSKLIKLTGFPVVTLISHGHHLRQPFWNLKPRKLKTSTDMTYILSPEQIKDLSVKEITKVINEHFHYDDYRYQVQNDIHIKESFRAEGLHKPLYKCPHCKKDHVMDSKDNTLFCTSCGVTYEMDTLGKLKNVNGDTIFSHIPDWYEWQRQEVRKEIEDGNYDVTLEVDVDMLPNSTGFYRVGPGTLTHNEEGYTLKGEGFEIKKPVKANFGVHIEYDYFGRGDGLSFSTKEDTFYMYPKDQSYAITKYHFATEELYKLK